MACVFMTMISGDASRWARAHRLILPCLLAWLVAAPARVAFAADAEIAANEAWQPQARLALSSGVDGNVRYAPPGGIDASVSGQASRAAAFAALSAGLGVETVLGASFELSLEYELFQIAYSDRALASYDFQEHALGLRLGRSEGWLSWEVGARADLSFTGVGTAVVPFQRSASVEPQVTLWRNRMLRLRVGATYLAIETLDANLAFLSGQRLEGRLIPELALAGWRLSLPLRVRRDFMGVDRGEMIPTEDPAICATCGVQSVTPYSNQAAAAGLRLSTPYGWPVRPGAFLRVERRTFLTAQYDEQHGADGAVSQVDSQVRVDDRFAAGASVAVPLYEHWSVSARYDYTRSSTWFVGRQVVSDPRRSYHKHTASLELEWSWM